jgi:hypothetical protein
MEQLTRNDMKKAVVTYVEELPCYLLARTKEIHETSLSVALYEEFLHTR